MGTSTVQKGTRLFITVNFVPPSCRPENCIALVFHTVISKYNGITENKVQMSEVQMM